jgi:hypothetical protein
MPLSLPSGPVFALDEAQQLGAWLLFFDNGVADVGPVKAADEHPRALQLQALNDVRAGQVVGGGGQGHAGHTRIALVQHRQCPGTRAKVVAPLAHAVRFVDRKQTQQTALVQRIEQGQKTRCGDALGRGVQHQ